MDSEGENRYPSFPFTAERRNKRVDVGVTAPMFRAINRMANYKQLTRADIVRQAMLAGLPIAFPEFKDILEQEMKNG